MEERLYFAYGSNMNLEQMALRCPDAVAIGSVTLDGYELAFRGSSGVATIIPKEGANVQGLLWGITPECEKALDQYEGYPKLYGKQQVDVKRANGAVLPVMAYVMTPEYSRITARPSPGYFLGIKEGYEASGIHTEPLFDALKRAIPQERSIYWDNRQRSKSHSRSHSPKPKKRER